MKPHKGEPMLNALINEESSSTNVHHRTAAAPGALETVKSLSLSTPSLRLFLMPYHMLILFYFYFFNMMFSLLLFFAF